MAARSDAAVLTFGASSGADVHVTDVVLDELARASFTVRTPWGTTPVRLGVSGRHMVANAAAALAIAGVVGADLAAAAQALAGAGVSPMRMQLVRSASGGVIVEDCYNANPTSMRAALAALADLPATRRVALLGLMAEISDSPAEHRAIRAEAERLGIEVLPVGTDLYGIAPIDDPVAAIGALAEGDALLVKGSRVVGLERWVGVLQAM